MLGAQRAGRQREPDKPAVELVAQGVGVEIGQACARPRAERHGQLECAVVVGVEQLARLAWWQQLDAERARRRDQREVEALLACLAAPEVGVVVSRIDETGRIQLADGRMLPANYRHFDYGYAVTAHRSQGKSVDAVVISADAMKKELFYVAASRGRENVTVVTSDKELLRESVGRSGERQSATELVRKAAGGRPWWRRLWFGQAFERGRNVARAMARHAARQDYDSGIKAPLLQKQLKEQIAARDDRKERRRDYGLSR